MKDRESAMLMAQMIATKSYSGRHEAGSRTASLTHTRKHIKSRTQSLIAWLVASLSVAVPEFTGRTSAPMRRMRKTLSCWRSMSCTHILKLHGGPNRTVY